MRTSDNGGYQTFMSDANSSYSQAMFTLYVDAGNNDCTGATDQFAYYQTASGSLQCSGVTAQLNTWYHIAVSRSSNGVRRFFVNGVLVNTQNGTPNPSDSSGVVSFGRAGSNNGEYFAGRIDEARISNTAIYTANFTIPTSPLTPSTSTVGLWRFNEGVGQTTADSSGNNRNGTLGSAATADSADPLWSPITSY